jgi:8-oxo-dGTP pyrophosphatase MutT (NUDIX family)
MQLDDAAVAARLDPVSEEWDDGAGSRGAAVVVPIQRRADGDVVVFTERPRGLRRHAGQVSFPGGTPDPGETPLACALRELREELGVRGGLRVLGALPRRTTTTGFHVHPFVVRLPTGDVAPDRSEVERVLPIPLAALREEARWAWRQPPAAAQAPPGPHFDHDGATVWGLTARVARDFLERLP